MRRNWGWIAAVATSVAAVVLVLALPHVLAGHDRPLPLVPQPTTQPVDLDSTTTQSWQPIGCPPGREETCVTPGSLDHGGAIFRRLGGAGQPVLVAGTRHTTLTMVASSVPGDRWVLVGAEHATALSRLVVSVGSAAAVTVPQGKLSLLPIPRVGRVVVTVTDRGTPADAEVLRIQQYTDR